MKLKNLQIKGCRDGYGEALIELGKKDPKTVALCGDLEGSTRAKMFQKEFPDRFFTAGIAEQNMTNIAGGMSLVGFIPHISSFGVFLLRAIEQMRNAIAIGNLNVKVTGSHCGMNIGPDGFTQMGTETIAMFRSLPNFKVIWPCDYEQTKLSTHAIHKVKGPCYQQFGRLDLPVLTSSKDEFKIGKAQTMVDGSDVTIISAGSMLYESLLAAEELKKKKISAEVINLHTIKPIDEAAIVKAAKNTGRIVTAEDHQKFGGLGSAVAEVLSTKYPTKMGMVAIDDVFGESGTPEELLKKYGLTSEDVVKKVVDVLN
ncbi:MAG: transketolase C-terminal domain-containing protein [Candidatus Woesearchaeota archaeon]|jgi:transketolase|nr:transketolase C-terminal domain-containing protein [Candidatus Woesearchaeota archaeon]